jgi:hypothetical protein
MKRKWRVKPKEMQIRGKKDEKGALGAKMIYFCYCTSVKICLLRIGAGAF